MLPFLVEQFIGQIQDLPVIHFVQMIAVNFKIMLLELMVKILQQVPGNFSSNLTYLDPSRLISNHLDDQLSASAVLDAVIMVSDFYNQTTKGKSRQSLLDMAAGTSGATIVGSTHEFIYDGEAKFSKLKLKG